MLLLSSQGSNIYLSLIVMHSQSRDSMLVSMDHIKHIGVEYTFSCEERKSQSKHKCVFPIFSQLNVMLSVCSFLVQSYAVVVGALQTPRQFTAIVAVGIKVIGLLLSVSLSRLA